MRRRKHTLSTKDLYGGVFDIAMGTHARPNLNAVKAALLFHESIIVPDSFFVTYGPLATMLKEEIRAGADQSPSGELSHLLRNGLIIPALRKGTHISDTWFEGGDVGIEPGRYLVQSKQDGDSFFSALQKVSMRYAQWPQDMGKGSTHPSFAEICHRYFFDPQFGFPSPDELDKLLNSRIGDVQLSMQQGRALRLMDDVLEIVDREKGNPTFRRGQIEEVIARRLEIGKFSYDIIWKQGGLDFQMAKALISTLSTAYEKHQASALGTSVYLVDHHDPISIVGANAEGLARSGAVASCGLELLPTIDVTKVTARDIVAIRNDEVYRSHFQTARKLRGNLVKATATRDDLEALYEFNQSCYVPQILKVAPHALKKPITAPVERFAQKASKAGNYVDLLTLFAGGIPVSTSFRIGLGLMSEVSQVIGMASFFEDLKDISWIDRFVQKKQRSNQIDRLAKNLKIH